MSLKSLKVTEEPSTQLRTLEVLEAPEAVESLTSTPNHRSLASISPAASACKLPTEGNSRLTVTSKPPTALNSRHMISVTTSSADAFTTTQSKTGRATMLRP